MSAPYTGLGEIDPNHPLEVEGQVFISNVEQGTITNSVPFEVYSDYTGIAGSILQGARQLRLRVTPTSVVSANVNIDMGIEPSTGDYLYIGNPVTNTALSSNSAFRVQNTGDIYMGNNLRVVGTITTSNIEGASPITINAGTDPVKIIGTGGLTVSGGISATSLTGSGAALTALDASSISSGTIANGRLPNTISVANVVATANLSIPDWIHHTGDDSTFGFSGTDTIQFRTGGTTTRVQINNSGLSATNLTGSGAALTALNATNIGSGTINNSYLPGTISVANVVATANLSIPDWIHHIGDNSAFGFSGTDTIQFKTNANVIAQVTNNGLSATALTGSGAALTALNASSITSGTINLATVSASSNLLIGSWISHIGDNSAFGFSDNDTISFRTGGTTTRAQINNSGLSATALTGSGAAISSINASNISSGTINNSYLPGTIDRTIIKGATISTTGKINIDNQVNIGFENGSTGQGLYDVGIGYRAAKSGQSNWAVAIGFNTAGANQGTYSVAVGPYAGSDTQGNYSVAIGYNAGQTGQGNAGVAIGYNAGSTTQKGACVAIGNSAGRTTQGSQSVAIGNYTGYSNQGSYSVALGYAAGYNQHEKTVVINGREFTLESLQASSCYIKPIRSITNSNYLRYNSSTGEVSQFGSSDRRMKRNIQLATTSAVDEISKLNVYTFEEKDNGIHPENAETIWTPRMGVISQEVYKNAPSMRHAIHIPKDVGDIDSFVPPEDPNDPTVDWSVWGTETATLDYMTLVPHTMKAIQELNKEINNLKIRTTELENASASG